MSLAGAGVIAIWNDITPEGRDNFYRWHDQQHIPERVGIVGFRRGRRYIALRGAPEFFTLYEVEDRAVLSGPAYRARLDAPTEWTTRSVLHFRNTARSLCDVLASTGIGSGGVIGTIRFDCDPTADAVVEAHLARDVLPNLLDRTGLAAAHLCRADLDASRVKTAEQKGRADNLVPRWVVLLEGSLPAAVEDAFSGALSAGSLAAIGVPQAEHGVYRLEFDLHTAPETVAGSP
jgi:hypothetical protein